MSGSETPDLDGIGVLAISIWPKCRNGMMSSIDATQVTTGGGQRGPARLKLSETTPFELFSAAGSNTVEFRQLLERLYGSDARSNPSPHLSAHFDRFRRNWWDDILALIPEHKGNVALKKRWPEVPDNRLIRR